jgi:fumarate hydratase, class II
LRLLTSSAWLLADRCVDGVAAEVDRCRELAASSPSVVTALNRFLGYEAAAAVAKKALADRTTIRQAVIDLGHVERGTLTLSDLDAALDLLAMT